MRMRTSPRRGLVSALVILGLATAVGARAAPVQHRAQMPIPAVHGRSVSTQHVVTVDSRRIHYTATAGILILRNGAGKPTARMFYIAYRENGIRNESQRPITFAYNGGPGGASVLVDFGGFGPRRIIWPHPGADHGTRPPYRIVPNPDTLLGATDLVFVDAVGTGLSRILPAGSAKMFYGINQDASAFRQFIAQYLTRNRRWNSPKFILGESYGTTRSAVLAADLARHGIDLNGVIMCSTVLDFPTLAFAPGNDLPYIFYLPSYAAVAWYHHRLHPEPKSLPDWVAQVERFAEGPYAAALFQGSALPPAQLRSIASELARDTGLPARLWREADLRISLPVFQKKLLSRKHRSVGRFDGRFSMPELEPLLPVPGQSSAGAASSAIMGALTASFNNYLEQNLHYVSHLHYRQLDYKVNAAWKWAYEPPVESLTGLGQFYLNVAPALARAMLNDPGLRVLFNNGYFDMATPFFATLYTVHHMGLPPSVMRRIEFRYYPSGHMLYLNPKALPLLQTHIDHFIERAR
ncbi:MAG: S10 family peptidase [Gammaproteobacteria bacterium]